MLLAQRPSRTSWLSACNAFTLGGLIHIGEDMKTLNFWRALFDGGIFANPVVPPAVPLNRSLIRTSYMASHTDEDVDLALELFERIGRQFGLLA